MEDGAPEEPLLNLRMATHEQALSGLDAQKAAGFRGVDLSLLDCGIDAELADKLCGALVAVPAGGATLRLSHNDLSSGTDCEQRLFDLRAERKTRESEKAFHEKKKRESSSQKDFSISARMRREAIDGISVAESRLAAIDEELKSLEQCRTGSPWYLVFSRLEAAGANKVRRLDLANCSLHATGLQLLAQVLLELEQRAEGEKITELVLDGNDLGDRATASIASLMKLTGMLQGLQLRNVGVTETGVSQILSGLVSNKSLRLLDLRDNGLAAADVCKAALGGVRRFNGTVEVLLS